MTRSSAVEPFALELMRRGIDIERVAEGTGVSVEELHLMRALHVLETMTFAKKERANYEARLKWLRMETADLEEWEEDSFKGGMEKGIEEVALHMLQENMDISLIMKLTDLTEDALNDLRRG